MLKMQMPQARSETLNDVDRMIWKLCHKFIRRYGGELDEARSVANEAYARAYCTYDRTRAFTTWVWWKVWSALLSWRRKRDAWASRFSEQVDFDRLPARKTSWVESLSADARAIVQMIAESPAELKKLLRYRGPAACRRRLIEEANRRGWTLARIAESLQELREAVE